jgi:hypothetical protein
VPGIGTGAAYEKCLHGQTKWTTDGNGEIVREGEVGKPRVGVRNAIYSFGRHITTKKR